MNERKSKMVLSLGRNEGAKNLPAFRISTCNTRILHGMDKTEAVDMLKVYFHLYHVHTFWQKGVIFIFEKLGMN